MHHCVKTLPRQDTYHKAKDALSSQLHDIRRAFSSLARPSRRSDHSCLGSLPFVSSMTASFSVAVSMTA
jgi:hypothetical protein